jgi:hypothetical protein
MTTAHFVHTAYPTKHPGVARMEQAVQTARGLRSRFDGTRGLAAMLLAAVVAALLVVADQMIDTWAEGHLLAAWVALWAVGFAAIGLLAGTVRSLSGRVIRALDAWSARVAQARADERLWAIAQSDARVMAELKVAMARSDETAPDVVAQAPLGGADRAAAIIRKQLYYI